MQYHDRSINLPDKLNCKMSYHLPSTNNHYSPHNYTPTTSAYITDSQPEHQRQRSNSSGKKIVFIKPKLSNPSIVRSGQTNSQIQTHNQQHEYLQHSHHTTQTTLQHNNPTTSSTITLNPHTYEHPTISKPQQTSPDNSMKLSRGQHYEEQLNHIHQQIQFFTHRLNQAENKNVQLHNSLLYKDHQINTLFKNVYNFLQRLFASQLQQLYESMSTYLPTQDKLKFYNLVQKSSGVNLHTVALREFENDMLTLSKTLNLTFFDRKHLDQIVTSQHVTLEQNMKQLNQLQNENHAITSEYRVLEKDFNDKAKIRFVTREIQTITIKAQQKPLDESKKMAGRSREDTKIKQTRNTQTQTEEKRIGSAESVHKYKPLRYEGIGQRSSPYKNYIRERSVSSGSKTGNSLGSTIRNQLRTGESSKKPQQRNTNQQQSRKPQQKRKLPATSSYLNHLIQSQYTINTAQLAPRQNRFQQQLDSSKSQLSMRRPPLRNRSQSQQQVSSSRQRSNSKHSVAGTSSRVASAYSLNPVNQYGEKRLCNEMNSKKVRKITQLSQESESISERMRELMEEEEMLREKYRQLEQVKVSRENKKSRLNESTQRKNQ